MTVDNAINERDEVLAMNDDELHTWLESLRVCMFGGFAFKRLPWSDSPLLIYSMTTLDDVREQVRASSPVRRTIGMG